MRVPSSHPQHRESPHHVEDGMDLKGIFPTETPTAPVEQRLRAELEQDDFDLAGPEARR